MYEPLADFVSVTYLISKPFLFLVAIFVSYYHITVQQSGF